MAYTSIDNPELYFQTKLYTGNATDDTAITLDGDENMSPDFVWIKNRADTEQHRLMDSVRGASKVVKSSGSGAEEDVSNHLKSFDTNGFTLGVDNAVNGNSDAMVAWCWKAGTSFSNDASATGVGSLDSTASVSSTAGISILSFTGNATAGATVAHGMGAAPKFIASKNRPQNAEGWQCYHSTFGGTHRIMLDETGIALDNETFWHDTNTTSSIITLGANHGVNGSSHAMIHYCFAEKQGFSKFGSYKGGGSSFPFIYLGFKPACLIIKGAVSGDGDARQNWEMYDNKRAGYNGGNGTLYPSTSAAEDAADRVQLMSNGFQINVNSDGVNDNNSTYIYAAWAEAPFVNSKGVPCNAR